MILLINPPIYDFAAFNLWARPIGLLKTASVLKSLNIEYQFFDFLDISNLSDSEKKKFKIKIRKNGTYTYPKEKIEKPIFFPEIKRYFYRYGIPNKKFLNFINSIKKPKIILITSIMTYWYLGIIEIIDIIRKSFPESKIILGGIYANLCRPHALKKLNIDYIVHTIDEFLEIIEIKKKLYKTFPFPIEHYKINPFVPLYTSFGCPFNCPYCANKFLNPPFSQRDINDVFEELMYYYSKGIKKFAFYDDALLINKKNHFIPLLKKIIDSNLNIEFYTPNGLHVNQIDDEIAELMKLGGFKDIRLSLETANPKLQKKLGYKTDNLHFEKALNSLYKYGFSKENISVYLLVGIPYQTFEDVKASIEYSKKFDVKIKLAEYSPIPYTLLWNESIKTAKYDIINEPLFHNNTLLPVSDSSINFESLKELKHMART